MHMENQIKKLMNKKLIRKNNQLRVKQLQIKKHNLLRVIQKLQIK